MKASHELRLQALLEGLQTLNEPLELKAILEALVHTSSRLFEADRCGIYLLDPDSKQLTCPASRGLSEHYLQAVRRHMPWPWDVAAKPEPLVVPDAPHQPEFADLREVISEEGLHTILFLPLFHNELLGKLAIYHDHPRLWEKEAIQLAQMLADQATLAITKARLFEKEKRWAQTLEEFQVVGCQLASRHELPELLQLIVETAARLLRVRGGGLYLVDEATDELELVISHNLGKDKSGLRLKRGEGLSGHVWQTGQPLVVEDYRYWQGRSEKWTDVPITSVAAVPLQYRGRVIGVLNATNLTDPRRFSEEDVRILMMLAGQAAAEIERNRLEQLQRMLLDLGAKILTAHETGSLLQRIVQAITEYSTFKLAAISLFDRPIDPAAGEQGQITQIMIAGLTPQEEMKLQKLADSGEFIPCWQILQKGKSLGSGYYVTPELIPEIVPKGVKGRVSREAPEAWGAYDNLYFLLRQEQKIIGRISLGDPIHGRVPTPEELAPLELFVNLAALALEKARDTEELKGFQKRLQGIYRLSERLAQLTNLDDLITHAVETIREHFAYDHVTLFLKEGETLVRKGFHTTLPVEKILFERFERLPLEQGICGWVARERQPALVGDVRQDSRYIVGHSAIRSELAAPVMTGGNELAGVLNIESTEENAFTQEDLELLLTLARQLASAIDNLRHRQHLQEVVKEQEWSNRFLQKINAIRGFEEVLTMIIQHGIDLLSPKANAGNFLIWNRSKKVFKFRAAVNRDLEPLKKVALRREDLVELTAKTREPVIFTRSLQMAHPELSVIWKRFGQLPPPSTIVVPIRDGEQVVAVLNINNLDQEGVFTQDDVRKIQTLVPEIELVLSRARDHERLRELALHDSLTGAFNRHYFTEFILKEQERARRYDYPISLVMVDMDDFYEINDRFGHAEGDRVLHKVAQLLMNTVRAADIVVRYGGDEFLIIMPQTGQAEAKEVMQRLRQRLEKWAPKLPAMKISISFGVASWTPKGRQSLEQVLEKADEFMYHRRRASSRARRARKQAIIATPRSRKRNQSKRR